MGTEFSGIRSSQSEDELIVAVRASSRNQSETPRPAAQTGLNFLFLGGLPHPRPPSGVVSRKDGGLGAAAPQTRGPGDNIRGRVLGCESPAPRKLSRRVEVNSCF